MTKAPFLKMPFLKMHGLGNDFVVLDGRRTALDLTPARRRAIADRRLGVGCDQLIVLEPPTERGADVFMRIYNPDGGEAGACGNATRCVASVVMDERKADQVTVQTISGLLDSQRTGRGANGLPVISVDMGPARLDWRDIPVREACDTNHMPVGLGPLQDPVGTSMGNPHATFFVDNIAAVPLAELGPKLEHDPFFPERANIGIVQRVGDGRLRLRVWERGAGLTLACGSGACAAVVAASRRGLVDRKAEVILERGSLTIEWLRDDHVMMTGGIAVAFKGELDASLLA
ncbi:diaminopimelate epimerase [Enhydrobacter sp.]|jgi:diaminopimelate epimerase|uniref:diaminopimelate epimerase n=1 Tax=Enhydrobacter sp. TaxID=1894999 RepID=UPI0026259D4D|nr:diaminopimelate epimerase [Enhydrobacter sp.]WIM10768.1 MAG: Diaminopimelate epimerase [Enhydrobacter sp.]